MVKDWQSLQDDVQQLYHVENKTLQEVMRIIKGKHGFHACERSYRTQLQKWGYMKYSTESCPKPSNRSSNVESTRPAKKRKRNRPVPSIPNSSQQGVLTLQSETHPIPSNDGPFIVNTSGSSIMENPTPGFMHFGSTLPHINLHHPTMEQQSDFINQQDVNGKTQLHDASICNNVEKAKSLLNAGAAVDTQDLVGNEPLHYAVESGGIEMVNLLLRFGANVNTRGQLGQTPLHLAVARGAVVEALIQEGAVVSARDDRGNTPLHLALFTSMLKVPSYSSRDTTIDSLLRYKAGLDIENNDGRTPFHNILIVQEHNQAIYRYLGMFLDAGASITKFLPEGNSPFEAFLSRSRYWWQKRERYWASGDGDILRKFIQRGGDPATLVPSGKSMVSEYFGEYYYNSSRAWRQDRTLGEFLCKTIDPLAKLVPDGNTILHELCLNCQMAPRGEKKGFDELIATVLQRGAKPDARNSKGQTPLLLILTSERSAAVTAVPAITSLLTAGSDIFLRDSTGKCPLIEAARSTLLEDTTSFLRADLNRRRNTHDVEPREVAGPMEDTDFQMSGDCLYWKGWEMAIAAQDWKEARNCLFQSVEPQLLEVADTLRRDALSVLAEVHVEKNKREFLDDETGLSSRVEERRRYIARIIHDCLEHNASVNLQCFSHLVDLCL